MSSISDLSFRPRYPMRRLTFIILCLLFSVSLYARHNVYNAITNSSFSDVSVEDVIDRSYSIGELDYKREVRKYKDGAKELYLIGIKSYINDLFLVVSPRQLDQFLNLLGRMESEFENVRGWNEQEIEETPFLHLSLSDEDSRQEFEFIYLDRKKNDTYIYGAAIDHMYIHTSLPEMDVNIWMRIGKAPKFPHGNFDKQTCVSFTVTELARLKDILVKTTGDGGSKVNPDTVERVGSFIEESKYGRSFDEKREILRYGTGIKTRYYIQISDKFVNEETYQCYVWIKGIKYALFKKWLNDVYTKFYSVSKNSQLHTENFRECVDLPQGLSFGGVIVGKFDVDMTVVEGTALENGDVEACVRYDNQDKKIELLMRYGSNYVFFPNPLSLKKMIDALND